MIKVKVIEGNWYSVRLGENAYEGRCDFTYCVYIFGFLVYVKFYKDLSFNQSRIIFKGCEVINTDGELTKY